MSTPLVQPQAVHTRPTPERACTAVSPTLSQNSVDVELSSIDTAARRIASSELEYPQGLQFALICTALVLALVLGGLDGNIVATAVPAITDHFHTVADVGWYATAYRLSSCCLQLLFAKLYKLFSTKIIFAVSIAIFLIGSTVCAAATSSMMFVLGRAIAGASFAGVNAGFYSVSCQILPLRKRPAFNGIMGAVESTAIILAPILGGVITETLSFRWCFWINLPIGIVSLLVAWLALPNTKPQRDVLTWKQIFSELDLVGNLVLIPSLTCLFIAFSWAGFSYAWTDPKIIGLFTAFGLLMAVFCIDQYLRGDKATIPPRILKNRAVIAGIIFVACTNASEAVLEYYMPTYFQSVRGYGPAQSGYFMLPIMVGFLVGLLLQGGTTSVIGYYTPCMLFAAVLMPIAAGLVTTWKVDTSLASILSISAFAGFTTGIGFQCPQSAVQTALSDGDLPLGIGLILFAQGCGPALFLAVSQTIFSNQLSTNLKQAVPQLNWSDLQSSGISELTSSLVGSDLMRALSALDLTLTQVWYLTVGTTCVTMVGALMMDWRSVKQDRSRI